MSENITLRSWLQSEPFTLVLSAGFFGFFAHSGLIRALEEQDLFPVRVGGSSAGALVAGAWASGLSATEVADGLLDIKREDFWDLWPGLGLLRGRKMRKRLQAMLPVADFAGCRWSLFVSTYDALARSTRVIETGELATAIHASCALPGLFQPVWLGLRPHFDGGVRDRHGLAGTRPGERIFYHHLSSRSPWRGKQSTALSPPDRANTVSLIIEGIPRSGPFKLELGHRAHEVTYRATLEALGQPIVNGLVRISCI
jgi:NTE family protein